MGYARSRLYFIRVNTCFFNLIFCILWPWTRCLSSIVTLQLWTSCWLPEVLNVQNVFVLQYDYTLFFLSLRVQFHNCQYHCSFFPFITENACLQIFIAECYFPCVVMAIWMTSKYKHRLNKDWCHSYMSYCLSANGHMAIWLHILLFTDLLFLCLLFHSLWKLCNTNQTSAEWYSHVTGMPPTAKLQTLFL